MNFLLERLEECPAKSFLIKNWGLVIAIKKKKRLSCTEEEMLNMAFLAYKNAIDTYNPQRAKMAGKNGKNGKESKYTFSNHFAQCLKTEINHYISKAPKGKQLVSIDIFENRIAVIPAACSSTVLHYANVYSEYLLTSTKELISFVEQKMGINTKKALALVLELVKLYQEGKTIEEMIENTKIKRYKMTRQIVKQIIQEIEGIKNLN